MWGGNRPDYAEKRLSVKSVPLSTDRTTGVEENSKSRKKRGTSDGHPAALSCMGGGNTRKGWDRTGRREEDAETMRGLKRPDRFQKPVERTRTWLQQRERCRFLRARRAEDWASKRALTLRPL